MATDPVDIVISISIPAEAQVIWPAGNWGGGMLLLAELFKARLGGYLETPPEGFGLLNDCKVWLEAIDVQETVERSKSLLSDVYLLKYAKFAVFDDREGIFRLHDNSGTMPFTLDEIRQECSELNETVTQIKASIRAKQ